MKTLEQFVKEIEASEALQKEIVEIKDQAALEAFLKAHECGATAEEFLSFIAPKGDGELSDDAAAGITGGAQLAFSHLLRTSYTPLPASSVITAKKMVL